MAENEIEFPEAMKLIGAALRKKLEEHEAHLLELRKRETGCDDLCLFCGNPDRPGQCTCMDLNKAELAKVAPPGREDQVKELKGKVNNPYAVAWASYNKGGKKAELGKNDYRPPMSAGVAAGAGRAVTQTPSAPKLSTDFHMPTGPMPSMSAGNVAPPAGPTTAAKAEKGPADEGVKPIKDFKPGPVKEDKGSMHKNALAGIGGQTGQAANTGSPSSAAMTMGERDRKVKKADSGDGAGADMGFSEKPSLSEKCPKCGGPAGACSCMGKAEMCKTCGYEHLPGRHGKLEKEMPGQGPGNAPMAISEGRKLGKADLYDPLKANDPKTAVRQDRNPGSVLPGDKDPKVVKAPGSGGTIKRGPKAMKKAAMAATPKAPGASAGGSPKVGGMPKAELQKAFPYGLPKAPERAQVRASAGALMDTMLAAANKPLAPGQPLAITPIASNPTKPVGARSDVGGGGLQPMVAKGRVQTMTERAASRMKPSTPSPLPAGAKPGAPAPSQEGLFEGGAKAAVAPASQPGAGKPAAK